MKTRFYSRNFWLLLGVTLISSCTTKINDDSIVVGIQPLGNVSSSITDSIQASLKRIYGFNVCVLSATKLPESTFVNIKSPRYRADKLLKYLKKIKPDTIDFILGITSKDISTTKRDKTGQVKKPASKYSDWGIFGLGYRPGNACVVSSFRLRSNENGKTMERLRKVCMHELGHNLGLKHCTSGALCVMQDAAETIRTIDKVPLQLCDRCRTKIQ